MSAFCVVDCRWMCESMVSSNILFSKNQLKRQSPEGVNSIFITHRITTVNTRLASLVMLVSVHCLDALRPVDKLQAQFTCGKCLVNVTHNPHIAVYDSK